MSYDLISGQVIPAVTGGVFSFVRIFLTSATILTSPAYVLASYIIENVIGSMTNPADEDDWPLYVSFMPDNPDIETNLGVLYDGPGMLDGRLMDGPVIQHHGLQLRIRSESYTIGWAKMEEIVSALDTVIRETITVGGEEYLILNVKRGGLITSLGVEGGTRNRRIFTTDFVITLRRVI